MEPNAIHILTDLEMFLDGLAKVYEHEWDTGERPFLNLCSKVAVILEIENEFNLKLPNFDALCHRLQDAFDARSMSS